MTNCTVIIVLLNVNAVEEDLMYTVKKKKKKKRRYVLLCNQRQLLRKQTMCYQFLSAEQEVLCDPVLNVMVRLL